jgi:uncharacterized protein with ATP-grasp and redox domains
LYKKFTVSVYIKNKFNFFLKETIENNRNLTAHDIQRILKKSFCEVFECSDPFYDEKQISNFIAGGLYKSWKPRVLLSKDPIDEALKLCIAGNVIDYGANHDIDIEQTINRVFDSPFAIDHSSALKEAIKNAKSILYLADNSGEIFFDKLLIEVIGKRVIYVVKERPVLNDCTRIDTDYVRMDQVADVISNGFDAPSTILKYSSELFLKAYNSADLIISKGQGNFEGLVFENDPRIFFLLMAKCDVIAEMLDVEKGSFIVYNQTL